MCDLKQEAGPGRGIRAPHREMLTGCLVRLGGPTCCPCWPCWPQMGKCTGKHGRSWTRSTSTSARDPPSSHPLLGKRGGAVRAPRAQAPRSSGTLASHPPCLLRPSYLARCNSGQATGDSRRAGCSCSCQSSVGGECPRRPGHSALSLTKTWPTAALCRMEIPLCAYHTCNQVIQSLPKGAQGYGSTRSPCSQLPDPSLASVSLNLVGHLLPGSAKSSARKTCKLRSCRPSGSVIYARHAHYVQCWWKRPSPPICQPVCWGTYNAWRT